MSRPSHRLPQVRTRTSYRVLMRRVISAVLVVAAAALSAILVKAHSQTFSPSGARAPSGPAAAALPAGTGAVAARQAWLIDLEGAIGPAAADHAARGLRLAHEAGAAVVVLRIDTPGGLDTSMRRIIRAVIASPVPVLSYVAPSGARAASAGTYILYASHLAAMAPGTNIGAATPVALSGGGLPGAADPRRERAPAPPASGAASAAPLRGDVSEAKAVNDAVAYLRSLAEMRGRNADWAERAVRESISASADEALRSKVIDLVATDERDLLRQAHGRSVRLAAGNVTLDTAGLTLHTVETDWRSRVLGVIGNPNLAVILMMIGVYGLLFEFMNPGALFPGVIGAISLLVGLYALSALPLSYAGVALLVLGLGLMVAEAFAPSFGILGIGGLLAFVLGASVLVDTEAPGFTVSTPLIAGMALGGLAFGMLAARLALRARRQREVSGSAAMVGMTAQVLDWEGAAGHVIVTGERWHAEGPASLVPGQRVVVRAVQGLTVRVGLEGANDAALAATDPYAPTLAPQASRR